MKRPAAVVVSDRNKTNGEGLNEADAFSARRRTSVFLVAMYKSVLNQTRPLPKLGVEIGQYWERHNRSGLFGVAIIVGTRTAFVRFVGVYCA
jgi:hypothetical protein